MITEQTTELRDFLGEKCWDYEDVYCPKIGTFFIVNNMFYVMPPGNGEVFLREGTYEVTDVRPCGTSVYMTVVDEFGEEFLFVCGKIYGLNLDWTEVEIII